MTGKKEWRRHPQILLCKFCFASEVVMMMMMMIEDNVEKCQVAFSEWGLRNEEEKKKKKKMKMMVVMFDGDVPELYSCIEEF
jgi:hypothetical protein